MTDWEGRRNLGRGAVILCDLAALVVGLPSARAFQAKRTAAPREGRISVGKWVRHRSISREIGQGPPVIVLHGGPDFDHGYLLPDLDRLADAFRLIYYDQRGRGRSADQVLPEEVTLASEIDDLDMVRQHFHLANCPPCSGTPGARFLLWSTRFDTPNACLT